MDIPPYEILQQVSIIIMFLAGLGSVEIIDYLKTWLQLKGHAALALTATVAVLITLASLIVDGALSPGTVTIGNFGTIFITVFVAAQTRYRMLQHASMRQQLTAHSRPDRV